MGSKQVDVGFLNPLSCVMASNDYGVIPVCDPKKDATCKATFEALKGKKLAFVDPASTSGYLFPAAFMKSAGVNVEKGQFFSEVIFVGDHDTAAKSVYTRTVDASWTFEDVRDNLKKDISTTGRPWTWARSWPRSGRSPSASWPPATWASSC